MNVNTFVTLFTVGAIVQVCPGGTLSFTTVVVEAAIVNVCVGLLITADSIFAAYSQFNGYEVISKFSCKIGALTSSGAVVLKLNVLESTTVTV